LRPAPQTPGELRASYRTRADHDDRLDLSILERSTRRWVGEVVLNDLDPANRSCGFRIIMARAGHHGRGFGTEATRIGVAHAFETVGLNRVELEVHAFNPRARHVSENRRVRARGHQA
jgi:RimJ/RimL family protein N-acetyltransferase